MNFASASSSKNYSRFEIEQVNFCSAIAKTVAGRGEFGSCSNGRWIGQLYLCPLPVVKSSTQTAGGDTSNGCDCTRKVLCAFETSEKETSVLQTGLNAYLCGWLSRFFNLSYTQQDDSLEDAVSLGKIPKGHLCNPDTTSFDQGRLMSNYHQATPMEGLDKTGGLSSDSKYHQEQFVTANLIANAAVTGFVSTLPSLNAVQPVLESDWLSSTLLQGSGLTFSEAISSSSSLKKAKKESCSESTHCITPAKLGSPDALASWLKDRLPLGPAQLSLWGTAPGTKGVLNLWIELLEGEILLEDAIPPKRTVHVASVRIKNHAGQMLVEAHQEMADGSIRMRNRPLSEKMRPGEKVEDACLRGILEELGCQLGARNRVTILADSYTRLEEERESLSYPGLLTSYIIHSVDATVDDLPQTGFYTVENEVIGDYHCTSVFKSFGESKSSGSAASVKKHFWRWVSH